LRYNRKLCSHLHQAASGAWNEYVKLSDASAQTGCVTSLHCLGDLVHYNPHIHSFCLSGYLNEHGEFQEFDEIDTKFLEEEFSKRVFNGLLEEGLISEEEVESMRAWPHSGFSVYAGGGISGEDEESRLFIARYLAKSPVSLKRLSIEEDEVAPKVVCLKELDDGETERRELSPLEFLAELSQAVPDPYEQRYRYYGLYSARTRGAERIRREEEILALGLEPEEAEEKKPVSHFWSFWIKKVFEIDPMECPKCGSRMKVKAIIFDSQEIERFTKHLGFPAWRAPPSLSESPQHQ
jgi:hypothetical protein